MKTHYCHPKFSFLGHCGTRGKVSSLWPDVTCTACIRKKAKRKRRTHKGLFHNNVLSYACTIRKAQPNAAIEYSTNSDEVTCSHCRDVLRTSLNKGIQL